MPVSGLFEHAGGAEDLLLGEMRTEELETDRQTTLRNAAGERDARDPRQVCAEGVNVLQIHRQRVRGQGPEFERGGGGYGRYDHVDRLERGIKILADQAADLEGLVVVRIDVPGREGICTQHDAAFDFIAEAFGPRIRVHFGQVAELLGPVTVVNTIEP